MNDAYGFTARQTQVRPDCAVPKNETICPNLNPEVCCSNGASAEPTLAPHCSPAARSII